MSRGRRWKALALAAFATTALPAQSPDRFVADARTATARYRDVDVARADGFRRVGVEFPHMGEHWVNLARVLGNRFSAAEPSILTYATVRGRRQLVGVAYTSLLRAGEQPPASAAPASAWHEHNGSVDEESFPLHHAAGAPSNDPDPEALRLSVLHAWVWTPNPAGLFETGNADLPFVRLGFAPRAVTPAALNGISLALDESGYYALTLRTALRPSDAERTALERVVDAHHARGAAQLARTSRLDSIAPAANWEALWTALERELPGRAAELRRLKRKL
ncbi:MAG: hypothetical protein WD825_16575 [Gemmatimonadaceae bacterium]